MHSPPLVDAATVTSLPERYAPYWNTLEFCRHFGIERQAGQPLYWMARVRCANGKYRQKRLGKVSADGPDEGEFQSAVEKARAWFAEPGWSAPTEWSGLIVSAWSASGPLARSFLGLEDGSPEHCAA
jgi:hypothetical protein